MKSFGLLYLLLAIAMSAQTTPDPARQNIPTVQQQIEVTATRVPEDPQAVPTPIQVITSDELNAQGATDLRSALALATGVEVAPGADSGPASAVVDFWGLKEFDAFLLVVDGVPWGGAFNPAVNAVSLTDVDRIEVLRGPAPVMYGATSFVGVLQVIHKDAASTGRTLELHGGNFSSGGGAFSTPVPLPGSWVSRLTLEGERVGFSDDRTNFRRGHGLWRVERKLSGDNRLWFTGDLNWLDQDPASPHPRVGSTLSPLVAVDTNLNPSGAFLNNHRGTEMGGFDKEVGGGLWQTSVSVGETRQDSFRGFLQDVEDVPDNAHGAREKISLTELYVDSHYSWKASKQIKLVAGADYMFGNGAAKGADFDYTVPLSGTPEASVPMPDDLDFHIDDSRSFFGGYGAVEWSPVERLRIDGGIRLNGTREHEQVVDGGAGTSVADTQTNFRLGANVGAIYTAWNHGSDSVGIYADYRDTFKPAAIDFGIGESPGGDLILKPETSRSVEGGLKARLLDRRLELEASGFLMHFSNLVTPISVGGNPFLINAGEQRFPGFETGATLFLPNSMAIRGSYSFHDATFTDFVTDFDGVATQLAGKRIEMSAQNLASLGWTYSPLRGFTGSVIMNYTGHRYLNMRNTALAGGFATVNIAVGYRTPRWEFRIDSENLGDRRDPVSESEFGESQYYLMPARRVEASLKLFF